ncbi:MAG TPA: dihydrolipoamide acetyltransferase family protein, partial [Vicinamibacterales bacterium]|nr:dihydrolipoamide acetyltransferase family protein [Vicinamibacterales bacterium]
MPALEMAQETGKLVSWKKKEGDSVKKGELLLEVETDKAVVEIEAAGEGILGGVTAQPGAVVPVGQTIAWLLKPGERPPTQTAPVQTGRTGAAAVQMPAAEAASVAGPQGDPLAVAVAYNIRISPKARRLAKEYSVDITKIKGTGPAGEIVADDVLAARSGGGVATPPAPAAVPQRPAPAPVAAPSVATTSAAAELGALSSIGKIMAERTTQSWTTAPHFFVSREVDCTELVAARKRFGPQVERERGVKLTYTDLLTAAIAQTLRKHPRMNASWTGDSIKANADVNVGLAMAVTDAVVVGVVPKTDGMSLGDIASRRRDLTERARTNKLQPADITGATFTISNLGMYHVDSFTAIIVPPQAGILAVGAMKDRLVPVMGGIATKPMMTITLSCDHRVLDGARGA